MCDDDDDDDDDVMAARKRTDGIIHGSTMEFH